jgi:predicted Zn-dependent protease
MPVRDAISVLITVVSICISGYPQSTRPAPNVPRRQNGAQDESMVGEQRNAASELRTATDLTRRGSFTEAIPHLIAARGRTSNEYAAAFNLAICYLGTNQFQQAIVVLNSLREAGHDNADVLNLLAQAQIGNGQPHDALDSLEKAALLTPKNEKLYLFVADACMDRREYALGVKVVGLGLQNISQSARLHYERGVFLASLDQFDLGKADFDLARKLAPQSDIGFMAAAHEAFLEGDMNEAIKAAREGTAHNPENPVLLSILGEALTRAGATPGQPEFNDALAALEKAVMANPNNASSQVALGKLYLMSDRLEDAIAHLETARQLAPGTASPYSYLAKAYQRRGETKRAQEMREVLGNLNQAKAEKIGSAPGDRKSSYAGMALDLQLQDDPPQH